MNISSIPPRRVAVVGTSCAGKSTFAAKLAVCLHATHIELDASYWGPNWTPLANEEFRGRIDELTSQPRWVCDGNYSMVRDLVWQRADTVVWLNYSFWLVLGRALHRTLGRCFLRTQLYGGNRETFRKSFLSRDSILVWVLRTHHAHRREYPKQFAKVEHSHLQVIELRSEADAESWLSAVREAPPSAVME